MAESSFNIHPHPKHIESKIVVAFEKVSEAFRVLLWRESIINGLSPIQIRILVFLLHHPDKRCTVSSLATEFNVTKPTISDSVKLLLQKNLVKKNHDSEDTRSFNLSLSSEGERLAKSCSGFATKIEASISSIHTNQKELLLITLLQLIETLNKEGVITVQRMCLNCHFYSQHQNTHYCSLINKTLYNSDLRIDCPEHKIAS